MPACSYVRACSGVSRSRLMTPGVDIVLPKSPTGRRDGLIGTNFMLSEREMSMKWICVVRSDASMNPAKRMRGRDDVAGRSPQLKAAAHAEGLASLPGSLHAGDANLSTRCSLAMSSLFGLKGYGDRCGPRRCFVPALG